MNIKLAAIWAAIIGAVAAAIVVIKKKMYGSAPVVESEKSADAAPSPEDSV